MRGVEPSRESGQGAGVRARIYGAVAAASESERAADGPESPAPVLTAQLRQRMEDVRRRLRALADAAATPETPGAAGDAPERPLAPPAGSAGEPPLSSDRDKACMVALNMALNGASRDEADLYLAEHFDLLDAPGIVSDAYALCARMRANGRNGDSARPD